MFDFLFKKRLVHPRPELQELKRKAREYVKKKRDPFDQDVQYMLRTLYSRTPPKAEKHPTQPKATAPSADKGAAAPAGILEKARHSVEVYDSPAMADVYHEWEKKNAVRKSFSAEVLDRLNRTGMDHVTFYKNAWLDKKMFYKLKSDYSYRPSRDTAIKCCFALRLTAKEADELLELAGIALSPSDSRDLVLRFCLENGITDLREVNYILQGLEERPMT